MTSSASQLLSFHHQRLLVVRVRPQPQLLPGTTVVLRLPPPGRRAVALPSSSHAAAARAPAAPPSAPRARARAPSGCAPRVGRTAPSDAPSRPRARGMRALAPVTLLGLSRAAFEGDGGRAASWMGAAVGGRGEEPSGLTTGEAGGATWSWEWGEGSEEVGQERRGGRRREAGGGGGEGELPGLCAGEGARVDEVTRQAKTTPTQTRGRKRKRREKRTDRQDGRRSEPDTGREPTAWRQETGIRERGSVWREGR